MLKEQSKEHLGFERLMTMKDVRDILGVSYGVIYAHIEAGKLRAFKVTGEPVTRREVGTDTTGIRFRPSDVREFLLRQQIQ